MLRKRAAVLHDGIGNQTSVVWRGSSLLQVPSAARLFTKLGGVPRVYVTAKIQSPKPGAEVRALPLWPV